MMKSLPSTRSLTNLNPGLPSWYQVKPACSYWTFGGAKARDGHLDGKRALAPIGHVSQQRVADRLRVAGLDADLQGVLGDPPRLGILPQPRPALGRLALERILENDLRLGGDE